MARPSKSAAVDLSEPQELTLTLIERLQCPVGKAQAFLRDTKAPALRVRVTPSGAKAFVFEAKLNRDTVRRTIGDVRSWNIESARGEANRLRVLVDSGHDPRELERQQEAEREARKAAAAAVAVMVGEAWTAYLFERRPYWGERHRADHEALARAGGEPAKRGTRGRGKTIAGPIHPLLSLPLRELDSGAVERWAAKEAKTRPTQARLALRVLKAFLSWCADHPVYRQAVGGENPAKSKKAREVLGRAGVKQDALLKEQLPAWFEAVRNIGNPAAAAYLQVLLLTGARPGEVLGLRWEDINTKWKGLTIRDKVEGERVVPLTPYVSQLLHALPRRKYEDGKPNPWLFSSGTAADGRLTIPRNFHYGACKVAGIEGLTLHGLRRSFKSLTEWLEIPAGVVAQLMGHKPSATAEKHYTVRPLDLLAVHHKRIEAWILEHAGLPAVEDEQPAKLRAVT